MIKLYGNPYSRANRVRWALEASGTKFDEETLKLGPDGTGSQRYRSINPNGLVPAIDDDGFILFESIPICLYIAKKYAPDTLYVDSIEDEALVMQWSVWAMTKLERHNETASLHVTWYSESKRDASIATEEKAQVTRSLSILENAIKDSGFLVASRFTIADLIVCEVLTALVHSKISLDDFPNVKRYLRSNLSQPSAQKAFQPDIVQPYLN